MADDITSWLEELGLGKYASIFAENEITVDALPHLTESDLKELGLPMGPRKIIATAIADLAAPTSLSEQAGLDKSSGRRGEAERRQLTVMFCDLVGSTALSERLDPEDMRDVIRDYQNSVAGEIARFEGHVAKFMGDGVLAYFGWPEAHEDDAERAVRAGLSIAGSVARLTAPSGESLAARIGVATGLVVVGDLTGEGAAQEEAVVGDTPNLAARLQDIAKPGAVVVAPSTQHLLADLFELEELGRRKLKGIGAPVQAWRVAAERTAESRFEAVHGRALTPFVGREQEVALLLDRWRMAKEGEGQVLLLSSEAGVGKSRIVEALRDGLGDEPHTRLRYQCSPHHTNSALYPVINQLMFAAGFGPDDTTDNKFDKLETLLAPATGNVADVTPLFADLLSLPFGNRYPPLDLSPERQKEKTLAALIDLLTTLAAREPVLMIFEDAHWIDPTTREWIDSTIGRTENLAVLLVITHRPEFQSDWAGHTHVTTLSLNRLGRRHCLAMVDRLTVGKRLPEEVRDEIVAKTDGVPLFVEELTKTVLESGLLDDQGDHYALTGPLPPLAIPATLQDSLMARLDRLASVKDLAQIGAAIGREFSHDLLAAVAQIGDDELNDALDKIVAAELLFRRGMPPRATYLFKHALVQDAAYESMLRSRRQELHARIAQVLEVRFPEQAEMAPEVLAHHYTEAGLAEPAVENWLRAGRRAAERSANKEAIAHLRQGLGLLTTLPETPERHRQELALQTSLGPAVLATKGWGAAEAKQAYDRARELCRHVGDAAQLFTALWGIWLYHTARGEAQTARDLGGELLSLAEQQGDPELTLQAHHAAWGGVTLLGEFESALDHVEQGMAIYDPGQHRSHAMRYGGHDPGVCGRAQGAIILWMLGYPDRAQDSAHQAMALARELSHPPSVAHALFWTTWVHQFRRQPRVVLECAEALVEVAREQSLASYLTYGTLFKAWSLVAEGSLKEGIPQMQKVLGDFLAPGEGMGTAYFRSFLAEGYGRAGLAEQGLREIDKALRFIESTGEKFWRAETHRLKGELLMSKSAGAHVEAEPYFQDAIATARNQGSKSLELRATTSLARLRRRQGRAKEARDLLAPLYGWFTEGFDTADLKEAKELLDELS